MGSRHGEARDARGRKPSARRCGRRLARITHVLLVGGRSDERRPNRAFFVLCLSVGAWALFGLTGAGLAWRRLGLRPDGRALRVSMIAGMIGATLALGLGLATLTALIRSMNFRR
jgi:hypothetical protein